MCPFINGCASVQDLLCLQNLRVLKFGKIDLVQRFPPCLHDWTPERISQVISTTPSPYITTSLASFNSGPYMVLKKSVLVLIGRNSTRPSQTRSDSHKQRFSIYSEHLMCMKQGKGGIFWRQKRNLSQSFDSYGISYPRVMYAVF